MPALIYLRLVGLTSGALLALFLIVMILGYRRPRSFERILFFAALAQLSFFCGALLELNSRIYYAVPPPGTKVFSLGLILLGLAGLPGMLLHLHVEYFRSLRGTSLPRWGWAVVVAAYLPMFLFFPMAPDLLFLFGQPGAGECVQCATAARVFSLWLGGALAGAAAFQAVFAHRAGTRRGRQFHWALTANFFVLAIFAARIPWLQRDAQAELEALATGWPLLLFLLPSALLGYAILRYKALEFGEQRNLIYAVPGAFLALLYLALVRRAEGWFEAILPPEATAAILLFTLVFLFEPIQRRLGRALRSNFERQVGQLQTLVKEIEEEARRGDLARLIDFVESRVREQLSLDGVRLTLSGRAASPPLVPSAARVWIERFPLLRAAERIGTLEVTLAGAPVSGDRHAALQFLADQLPAMVDLCRLIEEKLKLERELAERERLALVGQMAASISHNLKNPLGSMKTLLQVQLENPELPESLRKDCGLVLAELNRLSTKLNQLLHYAKPAVRSGAAPARVAAVALAEQIVALLGHEAQRRGVHLEFERGADEAFVRGSEEAVSDVLSNLLVNAIEALPQGGSVRFHVAQRDARLEFEITDDGPGIPAELRSRIFQPFFTTKPAGTGLGLAIVERRLAEIGGAIRWESPVRNGRGTRFTVNLPLVEHSNANTSHRG